MLLLVVKGVQRERDVIEKMQVFVTVDRAARSMLHILSPDLNDFVPGPANALIFGRVTKILWQHWVPRANFALHSG